MRLIDELRSEHDLIDGVLGSFRTFVERRLSGTADAADGARYLDFFRVYAGAFHHEREETILFPALVTQAHLPEGGPVATLLADHRRLEQQLQEVAKQLDAGDLEALRRAAIAYSHGLWHHIDAENSVLLPESEKRLARHGVQELALRLPSGEERAAAISGAALVLRYPPTDDPSLVRGEGCAMCPSYGDSCQGVEREWWNEWEWEAAGGALGGD